MANHKSVSISNSQIEAMMQDPRFTSKFLFLKKPPKTPSKTHAKQCGRCGKRRSQRALVVDYQRIKGAIAAMSVKDKLAMKRLLSTEKISVTFRRGNKVIKQVF